MNSACDNSTNAILQRLDILEDRIYNPGFKKKLSGFSEIILQSKHNLFFIKDVIVRNPQGVTVWIKTIVYDNKNVEVRSNVSLDNHTIIIF